MSTHSTGSPYVYVSLAAGPWLMRSYNTSTEWKDYQPGDSFLYSLTDEQIAYAQQGLLRFQRKIARIQVWNRFYAKDIPIGEFDWVVENPDLGLITVSFVPRTGQTWSSFTGWVESFSIDDTQTGECVDVGLGLVWWSPWEPVLFQFT